MRLTINRMTLYEIDDDAGSKIIARGLLECPSLILDLNRAGLSEKDSILGALVATFVWCKRGGISFFKRCETAVIPGFLAIALGHWRCFFTGCCVSSDSTFPLALRFQYGLA